MDQEHITTLYQGIFAFVGGLLIWSGSVFARRANRKAPQGESVMEVAGAIVSDKAVEKMVASMDALCASNTALTHTVNADVKAKAELTQVLTRVVTALDRNTDGADDMLDGIKDAAGKLDRMATELRLSDRTIPPGYMK